MDGSGHGSSASPPPFLTKTYDMVDDPSTDSIVSWSQADTSFVVWDQMALARDLLPQYFKHNNFSSFVRQLNTYGFRKIDPDRWEFGNEEFIRGQRHLLNNIHRRKPIHSHSSQPQAQGSSAESERHELEEEIERLQRDKGILMSELQNHTQQQHGMERQMQSLEERLFTVDARQKTMMANLTQVVRRPGFLSNFVFPSDLHGRKRRLPEVDRVLALQTKAASMPVLNIDVFEKMESSLNNMENFFREVSETLGGDLDYDVPAPCMPSVDISELHASPSPIASSPEFADSTNYAESPALPLAEICAETYNRVSEIDVNSEPAAPEVHPSAAGVGVNDVFWEQFLTETPGSKGTHEVRSERNEADNKKGEALDEEHVGIWFKADRLADKMGNLTSAERA